MKFNRVYLWVLISFLWLIMEFWAGVVMGIATIVIILQDIEIRKMKDKSHGGGK